MTDYVNITHSVANILCMSILHITDNIIKDCTHFCASIPIVTTNHYYIDCALVHNRVHLYYA